MVAERRHKQRASHEKRNTSEDARPRLREIDNGGKDSSKIDDTFEWDECTIFYIVEDTLCYLNLLGGIRRTTIQPGVVANVLDIRRLLPHVEWRDPRELRN
ncbi:unnamed protein product [Alternaria burnsii]|nr:unnamed protein product [Alternaria burnsii]